MLNPLNFISKLIRSSNQNELNRLAKIVEKINAIEKDVEKLNDTDFPKETQKLKERIREGEKLDDILPEAFALVRDASKRKRN